MRISRVLLYWMQPSDSGLTFLYVLSRSGNYPSLWMPWITLWAWYRHTALTKSIFWNVIQFVQSIWLKHSKQISHDGCAKWDDGFADIWFLCHLGGETAAPDCDWDFRGPLTSNWLVRGMKISGVVKRWGVNMRHIELPLPFLLALHYEVIIQEVWDWEIRGRHRWWERIHFSNPIQFNTPQRHQLLSSCSFIRLQARNWRQHIRLAGKQRK